MNKEKGLPLHWSPEPAYDFPDKAFEELQKRGYLQLNLPPAYGGKSVTTAELLQKLTQVGALELAAGRIYEGHINALLLIKRYGTALQQDHYFKEAAKGKLFGIWNTNDFNNPVLLDKNLRLSGKKIFCSGGLRIDRPIITATHKEQTQMIIIHSEELENSREDLSAWKPMGMKASRSTQINFTDYNLQELQLLGNANDYMREPEFSTGAVRFAAVQLGGAQAIAYASFEHLFKQKRTEDPYQKIRMGEINMALESGRNWLRQSGKVLDDPKLDDQHKINFVNMVRSAILETATRIMNLAEKSVGLSGMMESHKMEQLHRDLSVYLKQPGPDNALAQVGSWSAEPEHWKDIYS